MADAPTPASDDAPVTFHVKSAQGAKYTFTLPLSTTALALKSKLATEEYANVAVASQRLIYSGKVLKDGDTLAQHKVKEGNSMHLVKSAASNQRQNPASQSNPAANSTTSTPQAAGVPQNLASGTGNDPLASLTGARYAGFTQLPSADLFQNPPTQEDMIRQLQDPHFAQMMREAMNNPQFIDMMINSNPQLRSMGPQARQILQSDHFRQMMTNPDAIRQMMQMQQMFGGGMGGFGAGGGQEAFPAPGATTTTENQNTQTGQQPQQQQNQQNPFAAMGGMGANPFGSLFGPPSTAQTNQQQPNNTGNDNSNVSPPNSQPANPFAALFNPAIFGGQPQPSSQNEAASTPAGLPGSGEEVRPNPTAGMFGNNPFLQANPQQLQQMLQNLQNLGLGAGAGAGTGSNAQQPGWMDLFGAGGLGGFSPPPDNRPPEERYATQLRQLNEMGFHNFDRNIQALSRSGGDVNGALEWLFSQP